MMNCVDLKSLEGKVFTHVSVETGDLTFENEKDIYCLQHISDYDEHAYVESISGDLQDLVGTPIIEANEYDGTMPSDSGECDYYFYTFKTHKGFVDVRYCGDPHGDYSTQVYLYHQPKISVSDIIDLFTANYDNTNTSIYHGSLILKHQFDRNSIVIKCRKPWVKVADTEAISGVFEIYELNDTTFISTKSGIFKTKVLIKDLTITYAG